MKQTYYPSLVDFLKLSKGDKIFEAEQGKMQKLEDMNEVISPYTGKKIDMKKVIKDVEKAKAKLVEQSPLYRPYVHEMTPTVYTWLVPTMATDGIRLFINPEFADSLSWLGKIFVLIHEIYHCILMHMERGQGKDPELFNIAADHEINPLIVDTTDDFDEKFVTDEIKGLYDKKYLNIPVEEIYEDLLKNPPKTPPQPPTTGPIKIDPTQKPQSGPPPPPQGSPQPPQKAEIEMKPGVKVRIKSTGQKGIITKVNADGTFEVDPINESLYISPLLFEGYKREDLVPILPASPKSSGGGSSQMDIQGEYETEPDKSGEEGKGEGKGEGKEGKDSKDGSGSEGKDIKDMAKKIAGATGKGTGETAPLSPEEMAGEQKRLKGKVERADRGRAGGIIDTKTGEQIAKASGYDEDEIRAGEDGRSKWEANAREIVAQLDKIKTAGTGRGDALINRIRKLLKPSTDWKTMLKIYVGSALSPEKYYRIGAKKHLHKSDQYLKRGLKSKKDALAKVIIAVDFSGSMFSGKITAFDRCISEIQNIIYAKKIKEIVVIFFDDGVDPGSIQKVKRGQKVFKPKITKGGGGTNFQSPLDWIKSEYNDHVNLCIFLTDGFASMPRTPSYHRKFIWVVYDNDGFNAPFGKAIITTSDDLSM